MSFCLPLYCYTAISDPPKIIAILNILSCRKGWLMKYLTEQIVAQNHYVLPGVEVI